MGLLDRLLRRPDPPAGAAAAAVAAWAADPPTAVPVATPLPKRLRVAIFDGSETLEVVGESHYLDALWTIVGHEFDRTDPVRFETVAVLVPEPDNPYDSNAIAIHVDGLKVGHLSRNDAKRYRGGILKAMESVGGAYVGLRAVIVGRGGTDGLGLLGVFLEHDPADFGLPAGHTGPVRTGLGDAGGSWYSHLTGDDVHDIGELRRLLKTTKDVLDRHYMFSELERRLYRSRDVFTSALVDFDGICEEHHKEMSSIRVALLGEFGGVPLIEMYKQQAIRWKKAHEWERVCAWARRGLEVYGDDPMRPGDVDDLRSRVEYALAKIQAST
jgi:hypothetical protein